jgi:chemotaxis protein methyltransferase CheR
MSLSEVREAQWSQLTEFIAERMGLHFPRERWGDLQRGLAGATREFGFEDAAACVGWLLSAPPTKAQLQVLASHLTIGESYFFRDKQTLEALAENILPELIRARRGREQRLRIWSAACCTGEEPYSLAILLHQSLPDLRDWHVTITATDINASFLHKAAAGTYGEWSFRNAPAGLKERYFNRTADGRFAIVPEIKKLVTFAHLNLVDDVYPWLRTDTHAMDVIFCRNVLMYFAPFQISKVIGELHHALVEGGWLAVGPSEASHALFPQFVTVNFPGAILYQKSNGPPRTEQRWAPAPLSEVAQFVAPAIETPLPWTPPVAAAVPTESGPAAPPGKPALVETPLTPSAVAELLYQQGRYAEAADTLIASFARHAPGPRAFSLLARALANQGKLADALAWCDRWIAADKLDPAGHYLRAVVLLESGDHEQTRAGLQRALYLHPDFVLAHFALGNLARSRGKTGEAEKHFANALHSLRRYQPNELLPESDGLTAGRLTETLTSITHSGNAP